MLDKMRKGALLAVAGLAVATLTAGPVAAAQPAKGAPVVDLAPAVPNFDDLVAPQAILHNQYNNQGAFAINSQNFEAAYDAYDSFAADDFVVPANTKWTIKGVAVQGLYFNGPGPAQSFNVAFYQSGNQVPQDPPRLSRNNQTYTLNGTDEFRIRLNPAVNIPASPNPRHVWVSVQANLDFAGGAGGQWGWTDRLVASNDPAAWKNPGGGFGVCPNWDDLATCIVTNDGPDFVFLLVGTHTP
jgi:hypothetical protein